MNGIVKRADRRKLAGTSGWRQMDHPEYDLETSIWNRAMRRHPVTLSKPLQRKVRASVPNGVIHNGRVTVNVNKPEFRAAPRVAVRTQRLSRRMQDQYRAAVECSAQVQQGA